MLGVDVLDLFEALKQALGDLDGVLGAEEVRGAGLGAAVLEHVGDGLDGVRPDAAVLEQGRQPDYVVVGVGLVPGKVQGRESSQP